MGPAPAVLEVPRPDQEDAAALRSPDQVGARAPTPWAAAPRELAAAAAPWAVLAPGPAAGRRVQPGEVARAVAVPAPAEEAERPEPRQRERAGHPQERAVRPAARGPGLQARVAAAVRPARPGAAERAAMRRAPAARVARAAGRPARRARSALRPPRPCQAKRTSRSRWVRSCGPTCFISRPATRERHLSRWCSISTA